MKLLKISVCLLVFGVMARSVEAAPFSLIGDEVTVTTQSNFGGDAILSGTGTVVDPGTEFAYDWGDGPGDIRIDFQASSVVFTAITSTGSGPGFVQRLTLSGLDYGTGITGVSVSGFLRADVATIVTVIDPWTIQVDFESVHGPGWEAGKSVTIE